MTQSIPSQSGSISDDTAQHQRLMELIAAEDAALGEVGCGRVVGGKLSVYLENRGINIDDERWRNLLREHLGHILTELDFDSIISQVRSYVESLVAGVFVSSADQPVSNASLVEHIPTIELQQLLYAELGEFLPESSRAQIVRFTHQAIHKSVLQPRHTWSNPIWVLTTGEKLYIVQAASLSDAIAQVKAQHPQETGTLEVVTVGGVLAPNQVIALELANLNLT